MLYSSSDPRSGHDVGGTTIQPTRQPVMLQALEKLLTTINRSRSSARVRNDGADRIPAVDQTLIDIVGQNPYPMAAAVFEDGELLCALNRPAGGIVRRIEHQHARIRGERLQQLL